MAVLLSILRSIPSSCHKPGVLCPSFDLLQPVLYVSRDHSTSFCVSGCHVDRVLYHGKCLYLIRRLTTVVPVFCFVLFLRYLNVAIFSSIVFYIFRHKYASSAMKTLLNTCTPGPHLTASWESGTVKQGFFLTSLHWGRAGEIHTSYCP